MLALGPIFQQAGVPFVTPGATSPKLPDQIGEFIFLACFGDNVQAAAGADFVTKKLNGKTAYLLRDIGAEYTTLLAQYFDEAFTKAGGQIPIRDDYKTGDKTFTAQITKLKATSPMPDVLYVSAMPDEIGLIVKQMRQAGVTQPIVGGDGYDTPLLIEVGGAASNDVYFTTHAYMAQDSTRRSRNSTDIYNAAYGTAPENAFARSATTRRPDRRRHQAPARGSEGDPRRHRHQRLCRRDGHDHLPARRPRAGQERR